MPSAADAIEAIVERVRAEAGGDFAFVLTRKGRLVTGRAPKDMPSEGRARLIEEARALVGTHRVGLVSLPREALVPYGGAAPVDVFLGVALEQAVLCVAMASWADKTRVPIAIEAGLRALEPLLARPAPTAGPPSVSPKASPPTRKAAAARASSATPSAPSTKPPALPSAPPKARPTPKATRAARRSASLPSVQIGEATLGRETLLAIDADLARAAAPPPGRSGASTPEIRVELTSLGRATEADLRVEEAQRVQSLIEAVRADPVLAPGAPRATQPWVELPTATKRALDAAKAGRRVVPPRLTLKLEDADGDLAEEASEVGGTGRAHVKEQAAPVSAPAPVATRGASRPSLEVWREALEQELDREDADE